MTPQGWERLDVAIDGGEVTAVSSIIAGETTMDATGCLVGPGFVDMHTHLREPGQTWKEDIVSASEAAAAGGFTAVTAMPNTDPPMDRTKVVESVVATGSEVGLVDVVPSAALTMGRSGTTPTHIEELYRCGVRLFTDDGDSVADADLLRRVMVEVAKHPGAFVAQHAEDTSMTTGGHMHEGIVSRRLGIGGMPPEAEARVVERDLQIAGETGARYHCQHVSARMTIEVIRKAKESGMRLTAEVTPHHLSFADAALEGLDPNFKMYPPLRDEEDRLALIAALRDGTLDVVATDHAPHLPAEKRVEFTTAPRGVIGLETAAAATWELLEDPNSLFSVLSVSPSRILGLSSHGQPVRVGNPANLVVFDPTARWRAETFLSKSENSPYRGRTMRGQVKATVHDGKVVYANGVKQQ